MGIINRTFDKLSSGASQAAELQHEAECAGCEPIAAQSDRQHVTVHGTLRSVTLRPSDSVCALEAELYDGSDSVTLVWLGRRKIEGISCGHRVTVEGRLGTRAQERVMFNPRYELDA